MPQSHTMPVISETDKKSLFSKVLSREPLHPSSSPKAKKEFMVYPAIKACRQVKIRKILGGRSDN